MAALFAQRRDMFRDADVVTVATDAGVAVAALSSKLVTLPSGRQFLHVLTQFVGDEYQHGRTRAFLYSWRDHFAYQYPDAARFPGLIVLKTYNPIAFCAMRAFTRVPGITIYPDLGAADQDPAGRALAVMVARDVAAGFPFDPRTGVIRGIGWPADLYPALPQSSHEDVNGYFARVTRPGDRVLAMLSVPTAREAAAILGALGVRQAARSA
jgi:hypothetical protein